MAFLTMFATSKSCKKTYQKPLGMDKEWTLESSPNGLNVVGVIFAIDSNGKITRIPGGNLTLQTLSSPVALTQSITKKSVSARAILNFLKIKNIDSTTSVSIQDTSHLDATFQINDGIMTVINDDIKTRFEEKSPTIESNIITLGLEKANLYLILETIRSPNFSITFDKSSKKSLEVATKIKAMIGVGGHIMKDESTNIDLVYKLNEPLTIFYKLRAINVSIENYKGTNQKKVDVSLGSIIESDELIFKKVN